MENMFSKWLKEAKKEKLLSREGIGGHQQEKCKSEFFLLKNRESKPIYVLETGRACLKENLVNLILESLPDYSVKFPCYTIAVDGTSPASSTFRVNKVLPRMSSVGIFTPRSFLRWLVGVVYSAEKRIQQKGRQANTGHFWASCGI